MLTRFHSRYRARRTVPSVLALCICLMAFGCADRTSRTLARYGLKKSGLVGAYAPGAALMNANLRNADLRGADFSGAVMTHAKLTGAHYDKRTKWPTGFRPQKHGMRLVTDHQR